MSAIPYTVEPRPDTGVNNVTLGIWLFLASEVMLFGGLFSAYFMLRAGAVAEWLPLTDHLATATINTALLLCAATLLTLAVRRARAGDVAGTRTWLIGATALAAAFVPVKWYEYAELFARQQTPAASTHLATYYLLTGVHLLHVVGGVVFNVTIAGTPRSVWQREPRRVANRLAALSLYWWFVDAVWILLFVLLYVA